MDSALAPDAPISFVLQYNDDASEYCISKLAMLLGCNFLQLGSRC